MQKMIEWGDHGPDADCPPGCAITLVAGIAVLVAGASLFGWRWYARPTTLTIAVGSLDGEASRLVSALASKLAQQKAPVRLTMVETPSALDAAKAFSSGKVDLAVVRGDVGDLSQAQAVAIVAHAVALLVAPPGSAITDMAGLKRAHRRRGRRRHQQAARESPDRRIRLRAIGRHLQGPRR